MNEDKPIPAWQKWGALFLFIGLILCIIIFWHRFEIDFWPLDRSFIGPNLVASAVQWVFIVIIAVLIWPPTRRRIHRFLDGKLQVIHNKLNAHNEHNRWVAEHIAKLHEKQFGEPPKAHPHFEGIGNDKNKM